MLTAEKEIETKDSYSSLFRPNIERSILSICLQKPDKIIEVKGYDVKPEMFLIDANRYIFYAINYLYDKKNTPDPVTIMEILVNKEAKNSIENFGGLEYLEDLCKTRISFDSIEILCEKLKQAYTRVELALICDSAKKDILSSKSETLNPLELASIIESPILELNEKTTSTREIYRMGESAEEVLTLRAENPSVIPGIEVGFPKFDWYTNGGQPGDLIMVCARAKTGKSTILTNWATKLAVKDKLPVLYFDTEMDSRQQEDRIISILSQVPHKEIVSGLYVTDTEFGTAKDKIARIKEAVKELKEGHYYHIYMPGFTIEKVLSISKKFKRQEDIAAIFFDYLKFPASSVKNLKYAQEWQLLGNIAGGLKDIAGELEIPIYSACQENRSNLNAEKKTEANVGGSDRILQLASKLVFLYNKTEEEILKQGDINGNQQLYIAFQRNGESDVPPINIAFDKTRCTQKEV